MIYLRLLFGWALLASAGFAWAGCDADVERTLVRLELQVTGELDDRSRARAKDLLAELCTSNTISTADVPSRTEAREKPEKNPTFLGIEIEKSERGSRGHDRLKRGY